MARQAATYRPNKRSTPHAERAPRSSMLAKRDLKVLLRSREKGAEWHRDGAPPKVAS